MTLRSGTTTLLQNLKDLAAKQIATDYLCIKSKHEHGLKNVVVVDLQMAILLEGEKIFYLNDFPLNCKAGNVLFIKPSGVIEVTNIPDNQTGKYLTIQVPICREVIEATRLIWAQPILDKSLQVLNFPLVDISDQLFQWYQALVNGDWAKARMALTQILLQLCHQVYDS